VQAEADINTASDTGKKSIIQNVVDQLNAGKSVEEVRNAQKAKASGGAKKKAPAPAKKKAPAKKAAPKKAAPPPKKVDVQAEAKAEAA